MFINPIKRDKHFSENTEIKKCILLTIWLINISKIEDDIIINYLRLIRHLSYYIPDIETKKTLIVYGLQYTYLEKQKLISPFIDFNLVKNNILDLLDYLPKKNKVEKRIVAIDFATSFKAKIEYLNRIGFVFKKDNNTFLIPYRDSNIEMNEGDEINVDIVAYDPVLYLGLANQNKSDLFYRNIEHGIDLQYLEIGKNVRGIIKSIVDYGIFVSLGEKDGLLHSSKVSYNSTNLKNIFNIGDEILVTILSIESGKIELDRISVLKDLARKNKYSIGHKVKGIIYRLDEFHGIYLELENGASGFIRKINTCFNDNPKKLSDYLKIGDSIEATITHYDGGTEYELSLLKNFKENPIGIEIRKGFVYKSKIIFINDIKNQIEKRLNKNLPDSLDPKIYFCPKCQKEEYKKESNIQSFLEFSPDKKNWYCLFCDYKSNEQIIIKFNDYPITGFASIVGFENESKEDIIGLEIEVEVVDIINKKFIEVSILSRFNNIKGDRNILLSKNASVEMGYLYEQFASISEDNKEQLLNLCKYYFGFAKMARSYFFSFLNDYSTFINSLSKYSAQEIISLSLKARDLANYFASEGLAIQNFPILQYLIDSLNILSCLSTSDLERVDDLLKIIKNNSEDIELCEIARIAISFATMPNRNIKEDIWENLRLSLKNNLQLIQEDELDRDMIDLRKRIRKIFKDNIENDFIECKGSFEIPIPSRSDLSKINTLENSLLDNINDEEKEEKLKNIDLLLNPTVTKSLKDDITLSWIKTVAAFANTEGGELIIGIGENKDGDFELIGLEKDLKHFKNYDALLLSFDNKFEKYIGNEFQRLIKTTIVKMDGGKSVLYVKVEKSTKPIFVTSVNGDKFYIRRNVSTKELDLREFSEYKDMRFAN